MMLVSFPTVAFIGNLAGPDMLVLAGIALLIFGRRLPEVGKNLGKTIVEFKKGLNSGADSSDQEAVDAPEQEEIRPTNRPVQRLTAGSGAPRARAKALPTTEEV